MARSKRTFSDKLTTPETSEAWKLDNLIVKGQHAFIKVGEALLRMRDEKLYYAFAETFEQYCKERLGWTDRRARQICSGVENWKDEIKAAKEAGLPEPKPPKNERQARKKSTKSTQTTANQPDNRNHGSEILCESKTVPSSERDYSNAYTDGKTGSAKADIPQDEFGNEVPAKTLTLWQRGNEISDLMGIVTGLKKKITHYEKLLDPLLAPLDFSRIQAELHTVNVELAQCLPYAVCPECKAGTDCKFCGGRGFIGKMRWDVLSAETKKQRSHV